MKRAVFLLLFASIAAALEPNSVRTTVYKIGKDGTTVKNLETTVYTDGLNRQIQSKVKIDDTKDRVSCTFYDNSGRPEITTKVFVDDDNPGSYLPGTLADINTSGGPLQSSQQNDPNAYSYTKYSDDPLSRVIEQNGPGLQFVNNAVKIWYFGVSKDNVSIPIDPSDASIKIDFAGGFITTLMSGSAFEGKLNMLSDYLLSHDNAFTTDPTFFLAVSKDARGNYNQELKDAFGRTEATRAMAGSEEIKASYIYDILGNLTLEVAPKPGTNPIADTRYSYNTQGLLISKTTPDGGRFGYAYTNTGKLEFDTSLDASDNVLRLRKYTYDNLDRLIITESFENGYWAPVQYNYYDNGTCLTIAEKKRFGIPQDVLSNVEYTKGRLVVSIGVNNVNGNTYYVSDIFSYDEEGNIAKITKVVPGLPLQVITFYYDIQGKLIKDIVECGAQKITRNYSYDSEGRQNTVKQDNDELSTYTYDDLSRLSSKTLKTAAGHTVSYDYNIRDWISSITSPIGATNRFSEILSAYESNGNITTAQYAYNYTGAASPIQENLTYSYDGVNRLTGVSTTNNDYKADYAYDEIGRFKSKKEGTRDHPAYSYYTGNNRLQKTVSTDGDKYLYDKHGNLVIDVNKKMIIEYDWQDMPVVFRFYDQIPATITAETNGQVKIDDPNESEKDLYKYLEIKAGGSSPAITLLSQVVMLYDASGKRVMKMEGK